MERGWRVGHEGRDRMYYEEWHDGTWDRIDIDGEMRMGPAHHVIYFATRDRWRQYPAWARDRRDEIIARITSEFREPDYEYHGLTSTGASSALTQTAAPSAPARSVAPRLRTTAPDGARALLIAVVLLFALAGGMAWLVGRSVTRGETYYPTTRSYLRRTISRQKEPAMFWASTSIYAAIGAGSLVLAVLGARARRPLGAEFRTSRT